jgi:phosphate starvation-inducible PhoH-like protein|tara:strand:+ start:228 stop:1253 length:1026 start_codon:yes stop_codon:yes gene_type:complete
MPNHSVSLTLLPDNAQRLANLCGRLNEHIQQIEADMALKIRQRGNVFLLTGDENAVANGKELLEMLYQSTANAETLNPNQVHLAVQEFSDISASGSETDQAIDAASLIKTPKGSIKPRSNHQKEYVRAIWRNDINFGIGPAGTGKTYLAVACAVEALSKEKINRILLVRPAVEAGEKLGFLPGDLAQKIDPYLRPLYDALYEMLGFERVGRLIEKNVIEVAPLAYMRGRTLNNSFIILDESQNTTTAQMKMFLTRIGFGSTAVITGDVTQIDLPKGERSGLVHVSQVLKDVDGIGFTFFNAHDVVRHRMVQRIVEAYEAYDSKSVTSLANPDGSSQHDADR